MVVDERLAALSWNGEAVGKQLGIGQAKQPLEVVGVAGHSRAREIRDSGAPMICVPSHVREIEQTLVVKTRAPLSTIGPAITAPGNVARVKSKRSRSSPDGFVALVTRELGLIVERV